MKLFLVTLLCATGLATTSQAQVLSDRAARNMLLGGIAGAIIGENNDHRAAQGALIGATAGLAWTALTEDGDGRRVVSYHEPHHRQRVVVHSAPRCDDDRTVVVVRPSRERCDPPSRVVVVNPRPAPRTVIIRDGECDRREVIVVKDRHDRRDRRDTKVIVVDDDRRDRRGDRVIVYEEGRRPRYDYAD